MAEVNPIICQNVKHFKETLKTLRQLDDKIIYKLNQTVPTESFKHEVNAESQCRELYSELLAYYKSREEGIAKCVTQKTESVEKLREKVDKDTEDNHHLLKELRNEQSTLRVMKSEHVVENVIKARTMKIFNERCWKAYTPPPPSI